MKIQQYDIQKSESQPRFFTPLQLRGNIIRWYPVAPGQKVLLVSEPCKALEETLREMGAEVTACELSENFRGDLSENSRGGVSGGASPVLNEYDLILHVGIPDTDNKNNHTAWQTRLKQYRRLLTEKGTLLLAVPNRFGLKYFAGCQDDHYDVYFAGPEGYTAKMTRQALSKNEYESLLNEVGFSNIDRYYPYPDYRYPGLIYSEERLPQPGELADHIRNFDKDRYVLFDEARVFGGLIKEGLFSHFTNSFLFVCHKQEKVSTEETSGEERILYSRFSVGRSEKYQIRTDIVRKAINGDAVRVVRKYPMTKAAEQHIAAMEINYRKLEQQAAGTKLRFCPVKMVDKAAEFPWAKGESLQNMLQKLLEQEHTSGAEALIRQYIDIVMSLPMTEAADVDLIFSNIFVDGDHWKVIDYEWTFGQPIPVKWIIYRSLLYLSIELTGYPLTELSNLMKLADISPGEEKTYREWEAEFQAYLTGDTVPIRNMVNFLGKQQYAFPGNETPEGKEATRRINLSEKNAKKLLFHLDRIEKKDGRAVIAGWACAKTESKTYIPVHIRAFDSEGNTVVQTPERILRPDVAAVIKADTDFPCWGFHVSFSMAEKQTYTLRLSAGRCQQEFAIT